MSRAAFLLSALLVSGCVSTARRPAERAATPVFDPIAFFAGHTEGRGTLKIVFHAVTPTLVEGNGRIVDGAIVLDQTVRRGARPTTTRRWVLHALGGGRYAGTLTDAVGPVAGETAGNRLHIAFAMHGGLRAEQWLYLRPGGEVADNVMVVRKFGLPVARLAEVIRRETTS